jgi:SAM-dependent methyltransferase
MRAYAGYQQRYAGTLRESDRVLIALIRAHAAPGASLLDMGCSTGNLLRHLAGHGLELHGADMVAEVVDAARADPALADVAFHVQDMLDVTLERTFDIVTVNAALMFFTPQELDRALARLATLLAPGGHLIGFDYVHAFEQELEIVETSAAFPDGLRMFMRSERSLRAALAAAGLEPGAFAPFELPLDLPRPAREDIATWTPHPGQSFRGSLFQPWCHFTARKP